MNRPKYNHDFSKSPNNQFDKLLLSFKEKTIFVEGINDKIIFDNIKLDKWRVESVYSKDNVKNALSYCNKINKIGIVDKDYDENISYKNLYYTDYNDIECTSINLCGYHEIYKFLKIDYKTKEIEFTEKILKQAIKITCMISNYNEYCYNKKIPMLINHESRRNKDLKGDTPYKNNVDYVIPTLSRIISNNLTINYDEMLKIINQNNKVNLDVNELKNILNDDNKTTSFRGHDFFCILFVILKKKKIETLFSIKYFNNFNYTDLEREFIINFSMSKIIKQSHLYKDIKFENNTVFE